MGDTGVAWATAPSLFLSSTVYVTVMCGFQVKGRTAEGRAGWGEGSSGINSGDSPASRSMKGSGVSALTRVDRYCQALSLPDHRVPCIITEHYITLLLLKLQKFVCNIYIYITFVTSIIYNVKEKSTCHYHRVNPNRVIRI